MLLSVATRTADILGEPQNPALISNNDSQLLYGEQFMVEESRGIYVYGHSVLDGYKGSVARDQLAKDLPAANALVQVRATHIYGESDFKTRPKTKLSFLSRLSVTPLQRNGFTQLIDGNWVFSEHIAPLDGFKMPDDIAQTATIFLGAPYLYAGRSSFGLDCSALVQLSMMAQGYDCPPRDSGDQRDSFGHSIPADKLQRNDVVYFKGHVGIMMDDKYIINATARHMSTVIEDIEALKSTYGDILHAARL